MQNNARTFLRLLTRFPLLALALLALGGAMIFLRPNAPLSLQERAHAVMGTCTSAPSRQRCYDTEIPKLMDTITMEEMFAVTRIVQQQDPGYWFCHELAHNASEREYEKDPAAWKDVVTRCPVGMCSNGCVHGAMQRHFVSESLNNTQLEEIMPLLQTICEKREDWNPAPQEQSSCYHELGHLSLYLTKSEVTRALTICDTVAVRPDGRNYLQTCREGVFMQIFEPREPDDFALIYNIIPQRERLIECDIYPPGIEKGACWEAKGWGDKLYPFCKSFGTQEIEWSCFREGWVTRDKNIIRTPEGIVAYCGYSTNAAEQTKCYNKLFYSVMAITEFDTDAMELLCAKMPEARRGQCFANTASRLIETDQNLIVRAVAVCATAQRFGVEPQCYKELIHYANFVAHPGSPASLKLCSALPAPYNATCASSKAPL